MPKYPGPSPTATCVDAARTSDCLVFTPTYNEMRNIEPLLDAILGLDRKCDVLVIDDQSTDGTTEQLIARAADDPRLRVIVRPGKLGIGSAHKLGWLYARRHGYARIVTLDADLSHDPADIPRLLDILDKGADFAIGSRYMDGGSLDYHGWRRFLSVNANRLSRWLLRLPMTEYTTSLRAARLDRVPEGMIETIEHDGYGFFLTSAVRFARAGLRITEIPIHFGDRHHGVSKIPRFEILAGAVNLLKLSLEGKPRDSARAIQRVGNECPDCGQPFRVLRAPGNMRCLACFGQQAPARTA